MFADKCVAVAKLLGPGGVPGSWAAVAVQQCNDWAGTASAVITLAGGIAIWWRYGRKWWPHIQKVLGRFRDAAKVLVGARSLAPIRKPLAIVVADADKLLHLTSQGDLQVGFKATMTNNTTMPLYIVNVDVEKAETVTSSFGILVPESMTKKVPAPPHRTVEFRCDMFIRRPAAFIDEKATLSLTFVLTDSQGDRHVVREVQFRQVSPTGR